MKDTYLRAFELQFVRFFEELLALYPGESQLKIWYTALTMKQAVQPESTRREIFESYRDYVYQPYSHLLRRSNFKDAEVEWVEQTSKVSADEWQEEENARWFYHFRQLLLNEKKEENKQVMWQYLQNLTEISQMILG